MSESDSQIPSDFFNQFLDDYFAESDEHLTSVKRGLLNLEQFINRSVTDISLLDELLRSFHTIKGISGMVGLSPAERLAHELEGYLRVLHKKNVVLSRDGFNALIDGTKTLEEAIESLRSQHEAPDISTPVAALQEIVANSDQPTGELNNHSSTQTTEEVTAHEREWRVVFVPTAKLADEGINVSAVRARLAELGKIVRSTPLVEAGEIAFEFILLSGAEKSDVLALDSLGLEVSLIARPNVNDASEVVQVPAPIVSMPIANTASTTVRVDLTRLDQLMLMVGELVVSRARLETHLKVLRSIVPASEWRRLQEVSTSLSKQLRDLRNGVMRARMVPVAETFERMRFVVRDLARASSKTVEIEFLGQQTEIDKYLVERLTDPLLHLVRNAVSHGIETEEERVATGKSQQGHLLLSAVTTGDMVVIEIKDDGRGIDVEEIAGRFPKAKIVEEDGSIDQPALLDVICTPGFSTREEADRVSGRGVGMDIVRSAITDLDGTLTLDTQKGKGTTFRIRAPLTLAIADALVFVVGTQTFAMHQSSVREIVEVQRSTIKVLENNEIILHRDHVLPLVRLAKIFKLGTSDNESFYALVVGEGNRATGLVVDKVLALNEVVVRSLNDPLTNIRGIAGATELGTGRPVLILDAHEILQIAKTAAAASA